jgi:hypothetical protein
LLPPVWVLNSAQLSVDFRAEDICRVYATGLPTRNYLPL